MDRMDRRGPSGGSNRRMGGGSGGGSSGGFRNKNDQPGEKLRDIRYNQVDLVPFEKNFFRPSATNVARSSHEVQAYLRKHDITMQGRDVPNPALFFDENGFPNFIMSEIKQQGFDNPTPIQAQGWPIALSGRDMVGIAQTGSGKTLAYILPALIHLKSQPALQRGDGPIALILGS